MRRGGGKLKGGAFERKMCRALTEWITGKKDPVIFWRSASSGAQATQSIKHGKKSTMGGDAIAVDKLGQAFIDKYLLEFKHYKTYDLEKFLFKNDGDLAKWWEQCKRDAKLASKKPLMIFKRNNFPEMVMIEKMTMPIKQIVHAGDEIIMTLDFFLKTDPKWWV